MTHSCLEIYLTSVVWTRHTFENNFGMKHQFAKYLKESCRVLMNNSLSNIFEILCFFERYHLASLAATSKNGLNNVC